MVQHVQNFTHRLRPGYQANFDLSGANGATLISFADKHGRDLQFPVGGGEHSALRTEWRFDEPMSALTCCYTAMIIGRTFGLHVQSSAWSLSRLAIVFSDNKVGYFTPEEIVLNRTMSRIAIKLPSKKIVTKVRFAPAANLSAIAEIMAALHGFTCREVRDVGKIAWHRP
jgi:hypothetical protein